MLELRSVSFSYDGAHQALEDVSLRVGCGERVAVLGHNGSGKSTLVKIMGALQVPSRGACFISGRDAQDLPFQELRGLVGVVFQDPENQIVGAVVEDDAAFAPENQGLPPQEIQARVDWALERVGMRHKRRAMVSALSGGEKQRVALAGALAARVRCLILDEPTSMLDPEGRLEVEEVLRRVHASGVTLIQVTHQLENFDDVDRVLLLSEGRLAWQGAPDAFWSMAESLGFELPPLRRLTERLQGLGLDVPTADAEGICRALEGRGWNLPQRRDGVPPAGRTPLIEVRHLAFRFDDGSDGVAALSDVSADVPRGGWLSIVGRTGSGKSTLAQHMNGLYRLQAGSILLEGEPLPQSGEALYRLRQRVGLVFQMPERQLFSPTVREELAFAPANAGLEGEALDEAVLGALRAVGLEEDFLSRSPFQLSGGEQRLTAIASTLAAGPDCVVLDEPLAGLDAAYRRGILALLTRLRDEGRSVVTITHDLDMALCFSDRVLVMDGGRSLAEGTPQEVLPSLMEALRPDVWPGALQVSARLRARHPSFPLVWRVEALWDLLRQGVSPDFERPSPSSARGGA